MSLFNAVASAFRSVAGNIVSGVRTGTRNLGNFLTPGPEIFGSKASVAETLSRPTAYPGQLYDQSRISERPASVNPRAGFLSEAGKYGQDGAQNILDAVSYQSQNEQLGFTQDARKLLDENLQVPIRYGPTGRMGANGLPAAGYYDFKSGSITIDPAIATSGAIEHETVHPTQRPLFFEPRIPEGDRESRYFSGPLELDVAIHKAKLLGGTRDTLKAFEALGFTPPGKSSPAAVPSDVQSRMPSDLFFFRSWFNRQDDSNRQRLWNYFKLYGPGVAKSPSHVLAHDA